MFEWFVFCLRAVLFAAAVGGIGGGLAYTSFFYEPTTKSVSAGFSGHYYPPEYDSGDFDKGSER